MPRLRAVWATLELILTLATIAWGVFLLLATREAYWPAGVFAAGLFFLVTFFLFAADHPDGRVVGLFGLAVFIVTNILLIYAFLDVQWWGADGTLLPECGAPEPGVKPGEHCREPNQFVMGTETNPNHVALLFASATALIAIPQALLLLFGHKRHEPEPVPPEGHLPPM